MCCFVCQLRLSCWQLQSRCVNLRPRQSHAARRAFDHPPGVLHVAGVQVGHLQLHDLLDLGAGDFADLVLVRHARALGDAGGLLQQRGRRRALGDEVEAAVVVDVHHDGDRHAAGFARPLVELHHELAEVDAELAQRRAHRRGGVACPPGT